MHFFKRAGLSIIHNIKNTIILILLFTVLATLILSGLCIQSAASAQCLAIRKELGSAVAVHQANSNDGISKLLPIKDLSKISKLKHVRASNFFICANLSAVDFALTESQKKGGLPAKQVSVYGVSESKYVIGFTNGNDTLTSGRHLGAANMKMPDVLIDEELAQLNKLKVGSEITLKSDRGTTRKFTIAGIYKNKSASTEMSALIIPYEQLMSITGINGFNYGMFFLDDPLNIDSFKSDVGKLSLSAIKPDQIDAQDAVYRRLAGPINNMSLISTIMVTGIIFASAVILSLILILNLKGRKFEIGVLLSLGEQKAKIVLQMALETLIPVLIAFTLSIAAGNLAAQQIGNVMLGSGTAQNSSSEPQAVEAAFTGKTYQTSNKIAVTVTLQQILQLYLAGILLTLASTAVPLAAVMRYHPKDILAKIE